MAKFSVEPPHNNLISTVFLYFSAAIFFAHTDADIPFSVGFGHAYGDVGIFGTADIRPVSLAVMEAVCDSV